MKRSALYQCAYGVLAAALSAYPAAAQTANTSAPPNGGSTIQEVVVTAQRFSESVQKTSLAIDVLSAEQLQGAKDLRQLQSIVPGVSISSAGGVYNTYIRGVGSITAQVNAENSVTYNQDGVLLYTTTMVTPAMFDLARAEILLGPQGTLYGRNASGGAINLISRDASLHGPEGYVEGEVGNYNMGRITAAVNVPLSDTLAVRVAGEHVEHSGYLSDGSDDQNRTAGRIRLLWQPTSTVTLRVGLDGSRENHIAPGFGIEPNPTNERWVGLTDPRVTAAFPAALYPPGDPAIHPMYFHDNQWSAFAQLDADLGFATLTVLPAYRHEDLQYHDYAPGFSEVQQALTKQTSLEARLAHQNDRLKWMVGAYYLDIDQPAAFDINQSPGTHFLIKNPTTLKSYAFFGQTTVSVTPSTRLIAGLRYTHNDKTSTGSQQDFIGGTTLPINVPETDHAVTWKIGVEQDLTPDSMLFATASRGFKGGGSYIDTNPANLNPTFKPEYVTAYELGSRNQFFDHTLQLNVEAFYWEIRNQQVTYLGFNDAHTLTLITRNAAAAHLYGVSFDGVWRATPNDTVRATAQYEYSKYDSFSRVIVPGLSAPLTTQCKVTPIPSVGLPQAIDDCSGKSLIRAPKWTGSVAYEHHFDLNGRGDLTAEIDSTLSSSTYLDLVYTDLLKRPAYALVNASLTYSPPSHAFSVTGWIRNISDQRLINGGNQSVPNLFQPTDNFAQVVFMPPRTYGVTARYSF